MSWLSSDSDKAKQTQEMHCSAGKRLKCSDPIPAEMRPTLLDSERKSQRTRSGVAFEDSARSREPLHGLRSSRATSGLLTLEVKMRSSKGRDLLARRDHTPKETRSDRDPCWDRSWLLFAIDSDSTHIPFPTSLRKAAAQGEERNWAVQPTTAGGTISWTHRARAPRSGAQDPPKETAARVVRAGTGRSSVRPGHGVPRSMHGSGHHWESRGQAQARWTRMSHFNSTQSSDGLGWETHTSGPGKW
jgi:hypothetical protein